MVLLLRHVLISSGPVYLMPSIHRLITYHHLQPQLSDAESFRGPCNRTLLLVGCDSVVSRVAQVWSLALVSQGVGMISSDCRSA